MTKTTTSMTAFFAALLSTTAASASDSGPACTKALSAPVEFRISHQNSPSSPIHPHLEKVVELVAKETDGRIKLAVFPNAQLGGEMQALEQAALGQNIIFYTTAGALATAGVPSFSVLNGPFLTATLEEAQKLEASDVVGSMEDDLAEKGNLRVLALNWFDSPRSILGHKGYAKPEDLVGTKMRVPEAPAYLRTFELLKSPPMALPFSELYLALQQGVVDAAEGGIDGMANANLMEVADTVTVTNHFRIFYGFVMSEDLFAALPEPCQKVMSEAFAAEGASYSAQMDGITAKRVEDLKAKGIKFVAADQDAYRKATQAFYTMFPEWPAGLVDQVRAAMK